MTSKHMRFVVGILSLETAGCFDPCVEVEPFTVEFEPQRVPAQGLSAIGSRGTRSDPQVVVGKGGVIFSRENADEVWLSRASGTEVDLHDVKMCSSNALAVGDGGTVLRSEDKGESWTLVDAGVSVPLYGIAHGWNSDVAYAVGEGVILKTLDGGQTWNPTEVSAVLRAVLFVGEEQVLVVGDGGSAYLTDDAGDTWRTLDLNTDADLVSIGIGRNSTGSLLVTGANGVIRQMEDKGGEVWSTHDVEEDGALFVTSDGFWGVASGSLYEFAETDEPHSIMSGLNWVGIVGTSSSGWALAASGEVLHFKSAVYKNCVRAQ